MYHLATIHFGTNTQTDSSIMHANNGSHCVHQ